MERLACIGVHWVNGETRVYSDDGQIALSGWCYVCDRAVYGIRGVRGWHLWLIHERP